jgi:hypothetical protein
VSQQERSIFWEVTVSAILSKKGICTCVIFRTVSGLVVFDCSVTELLLIKRYYILFLIPIFIVQVIKLVQFTYYNTFSKVPPLTSMHFATRVRTWRVARLYSVQCTAHRSSSISETVRNTTHVHTYTHSCLE